MKVLLLKDVRISHKAGEVVDISPAQYEFLRSIGCAEKAKETKKKEK
jgi:ribosomal protein L9